MLTNKPFYAKIKLWKKHKRILNDKTQQERKKEYEKIIKRMKVIFPNAKIVFALSTWVQEEGYVGDEYKRYNADIEKFNEIAKRTLEPYGVEFNDLYSVTKNAPKECWSDMTHFNTVAGIKLVGNKVVDCICEKLDIDRAALAEKEAELFEIPERILGN